MAMTLHDSISWASVFFQGLAALLWLYATMAKVSAQSVVECYQNEHGTTSAPMQIVNEDDGTDVLATAAKQTKINRWAALFTSIGIGLLAISTAIS